MELDVPAAGAVVFEELAGRVVPADIRQHAHTQKRR